MSDKPICDFCSDPEVVAAYPAHDFKHDGTRWFHSMSRGSWAACPVCKVLIDNNERELLLERSYNEMLRLYPETRLLTKAELDGMKSTLRDLHRQFFEKRK